MHLVSPAKPGWARPVLSLQQYACAQSATMPPTSGLPDCQSIPSTAGHSSSIILHCMSVSSSCLLADFIWPSILSY